MANPAETRVTSRPFAAVVGEDFGQEAQGRKVEIGKVTGRGKRLPPRGGDLFRDTSTAAAAAAKDFGSSERSVERANTVRKNASTRPRHNEEISAQDNDCAETPTRAEATATRHGRADEQPDPPTARVTNARPRHNGAT